MGERRNQDLIKCQESLGSILDLYLLNLPHHPYWNRLKLYLIFLTPQQRVKSSMLKHHLYIFLTSIVITVYSYALFVSRMPVPQHLCNWQKALIDYDKHFSELQSPLLQK